MCGIFCILSETIDKENLKTEYYHFEGCIKNRGPDTFQSYVVDMDRQEQPLNILVAASVLWLQGSRVTEQPMSSDRYVMAYNGDIYEGLQETTTQTESDTKLFFNCLKYIIDNEGQNRIAENLSKLHGPYSFIFVDKKLNKIYFGRDVYGRRSLLLGKSRINDDLILTSVAKRNTPYEFVEVPSIGVFCIDLNRDFKLYEWPFQNKNFPSKLNEFQKFVGKEINIVKLNLTKPILSVKNIEKNESFKLVEGLAFSKNIFEMILSIDFWLENVKNLQCLLERAVDFRISTQPKFCKNCSGSNPHDFDCHHATTGVLFSGGVDCAILALLCNKFVDENRPIDLINVSFDEANQYQSPDRITGLQTIEELRRILPNRTWNFVDINISRATLIKERYDCIADLIYPLNTVLDDSLGCALWFASRGQIDNYTSSARVLISGMGADELFGGYTKHRAALKRSSWDGLIKSLEDDWHNIPYRNLGRDDRVVSDHGRQLRTPYLDECVVQFAHSLPCWQRTFPSENLPQGVGEKILLRSLAYHLGLCQTALFKKRAFQFGSRIANSKENAKDISLRLIKT